jgi:serine/threonine-protein kinase HipA
MIVCQISLWGTPIGTLALTPEDRIARFNYDSSFLKSGIELSPVQMPLSSKIYSFPLLPYDSFHGLPGIFADALPDSYGNAVIDAWCASKGRDPKSFSAVERLCYVGKRAMGAFEFAPLIRGEQTLNERIQLEELSSFATRIAQERSALSLASNSEQMKALFQVSASAGGQRAKALIARNPDTGEIRSGQVPQEEHFVYELLKFDDFSPEDVQKKPRLHYTLIEYVYSKLALACGIKMMPCSLISDHGRYHFLTERFDRTPKGEKIMMASLAGLAHADFASPGSYSYEEGAQLMDQLGLNSAEKEQYFRRLVFNVIFRNQDDHVKNIAFLMDREGRWSLAPAYDLTFAYNPEGFYTSSHQMRIASKRDNITKEDLEISGQSMGLSLRRIHEIIAKVVSVIPLWESEGKKAGISSETLEEIERFFIRL